MDATPIAAFAIVVVLGIGAVVWIARRGGSGSGGNGSGGRPGRKTR